MTGAVTSTRSASRSRRTTRYGTSPWRQPPTSPAPRPTPQFHVVLRARLGSRYAPFGRIGFSAADIPHSLLPKLAQVPRLKRPRLASRMTSSRFPAGQPRRSPRRNSASPKTPPTSSCFARSARNGREGLGCRRGPACGCAWAHSADRRPPRLRLCIDHRIARNVGEVVMNFLFDAAGASRAPVRSAKRTHRNRTGKRRTPPPSHSSS